MSEERTAKKLVAVLTVFEVTGKESLRCDDPEKNLEDGIRNLGYEVAGREVLPLGVYGSDFEWVQVQRSITEAEVT